MVPSAGDKRVGRAGTVMQGTRKFNGIIINNCLTVFSRGREPCQPYFTGFSKSQVENNVRLRSARSAGTSGAPGTRFKRVRVRGFKKGDIPEDCVVFIMQCNTILSSGRPVTDMHRWRPSYLFCGPVQIPFLSFFRYVRRTLPCSCVIAALVVLYPAVGRVACEPGISRH